MPWWVFFLTCMPTSRPQVQTRSLTRIGVINTSEMYEMQRLVSLTGWNCLGSHHWKQSSGCCRHTSPPHWRCRPRHCPRAPSTARIPHPKIWNIDRLTGICMCILVFSVFNLTAHDWIPSSIIISNCGASPKYFARAFHFEVNDSVSLSLVLPCNLFNILTLSTFLNIIV